MRSYKYIFIVLVYRTVGDIPGFMHSLSTQIKDNYKVIIVNSFYDQQSVEEIERVAKEYGCDFISMENRGYSYGNNEGINYAHSHYKYDYVVVCNADIEIVRFDDSALDNKCLNIPMITTISGKQQNPYFALRNDCGEKLLYYGHKKKSKLCMFLGQGMNKVIREVFLIWFKKSKKKNISVYAAHGSFLIFPYKVIEAIKPVFDDNMFLYYEEAYLAFKLFQKNIQIKLLKDIEILHYEDGSTKGTNLDLSKYFANSYIYYYEKYKL